MKKFFGVIGLLLLSFCSIAQNKYAIIPKPTQLVQMAGTFLVNEILGLLISNRFDSKLTTTDHRCK